MPNRIGAWAAAAAALASIGYGVPQILQVAGILIDPWDRILIFAPSLALAPAFVVAVAAAHQACPPDRRSGSLAALALAILYAADVSPVYIVQLAAVIPRERAGDATTAALAACCGRQMPATAVDILGYTLMSGSTLMLAPSFPGNGLRRWLRWALTANGLLGPLILAQLAWPWLIYAASPWLLIFPAAMILLARVYAAPPEAVKP
jgi:hypothetical protein